MSKVHGDEVKDQAAATVANYRKGLELANPPAFSLASAAAATPNATLADILRGSVSAPAAGGGGNSTQVQVSSAPNYSLVVNTNEENAGPTLLGFIRRTSGQNNNALIASLEAVTK